MTVAELIDKLKLFPHDRIVLVDGYEDGFDDINQDPYTIWVFSNEGHPDYVGDYDLGNNIDINSNFHAVLLSRHTK
jgi:hypothetical protein